MNYQRLTQPVARFRFGVFALAEDLSRLDRIRSQGAPEAEILYASRILETLAAAALDTVGLPTSPNAYSNLITLAQYGLIPKQINYWAHALRRMGNDARHVLRPIGEDEGDLAALLAQRWLGWFFCEFRMGPQLSSLTDDGAPLWRSTKPALQDLVDRLSSSAEEGSTEIMEGLGERYSDEMRHFPSLPAVVADMLMDRQRHTQAGVILAVGLAAFPEDPRLRLLKGLHLSRTGELDGALAWLEPLSEEYRQDDEFTGILAGIYKRQWTETRQTERLARSQRAYRDGWRRSRGTNTYLGINAATTAMWMKKYREARQLAGEVEGVIANRIESLQGHDEGTGILDFWDRATLAEARLLQGQFFAAWATYHRGISEYADQHDSIAVSLQQAQQVLEEWGLGSSSQRFREPPPVRVEAPFIVGGTGHRRLQDPDAIRDAVDKVLAVIDRQAPSTGDRRQLHIALSEGTDWIVAERAVVRGFDLGVVLPMELADYLQDFAESESQAEFARLLDHAMSVTIATDDRNRDQPAQVTSREAAYDLCQRSIVERSDVLVAVWDGGPAHGDAGTGHVVAYARELGKPLVWIDANEPERVVYERYPAP